MNNLGKEVIPVTFEYSVEPLDLVLDHGGGFSRVHVVPDLLIQGVHTRLAAEELGQTAGTHLRSQRDHESLISTNLQVGMQNDFNRIIRSAESGEKNEYLNLTNTK